MKTNEMEGNVCLFCVSPCSTTFTIVNGQIVRVKSDDDDPHPCTPLLVDEENPPLLGEQLTAILILKNILGIKEEKLCGFLGKLEGALHPQFWFQVCSSCGDTVKGYCRTLKEFLKLEKKLKVISGNLKTLIRETAHMDVNSDDGDGVAAQVWSEVREQVLNEVGSTSSPTHSDQETPGDLITETPSSLTKNDEDKVEDKHRSNSPAGPVLNQGCPSYIPIKIGDKTRYKCPQCAATYHESRKLKKHSKLHSPGSESALCKVCGWVIRSSLRSYSYHLAVHHKGDVKIKPPVHPCPPTSISVTADEVYKQIPENKNTSISLEATKSEEETAPELTIRIQETQRRRDSDYADRVGPQVREDGLKEMEVAHATSQANASAPQYFGTRVRYKCLKCPATTRHPGKMMIHLCLHTPGAKSTTCVVCGWVVGSNSAYSKHLELKHKIDSITATEANPAPTPTPPTSLKVYQARKRVNSSKTETGAANSTSQPKSAVDAASHSLQCPPPPSASTLTNVDNVFNNCAEENWIPKKSEVAVGNLKTEIFISGDIFSEDEEGNVEMPIAAIKEHGAWQTSSCGQYVWFKGETKTAYKCSSGCFARFGTLSEMEKHLQDFRRVCGVCDKVVHKNNLVHHMERSHTPLERIAAQRRKTAEKIIEDNEHYSRI